MTKAKSKAQLNAINLLKDWYKGKPTTYTGGRTSHTEAKGNTVEVWDECRKPTEGEAA